MYTCFVYTAAVYFRHVIRMYVKYITITKINVNVALMYQWNLCIGEMGIVVFAKEMLFPEPVSILFDQEFMRDSLIAEESNFNSKLSANCIISGMSSLQEHANS